LEKVQQQNTLYGRQDSAGYSGQLLSKKVFILFTGGIFTHEISIMNTEDMKNFTRMPGSANI